MLLPGALAGITSVILGYPFDTIKTRVQTRMYKGTFNCLRHTVQKEGMKALYRGAAMPLVALTVKRGILYSLYEKIKITHSHFIAGAVIGGIGTVISCPIHVIKSQMQNSKKTKYKNVMDCIKHISKIDGFPGFYRGFKINLIKDIIFSTSYWGLYGSIRDNFSNNHYTNFLAGGISSIIVWSIFFPLDTIKVAIQTKKGKKHVKNIIKESGIFGLWKGASPVLLRVFPVSACSMVVYEHSKNIF